MCQGTDLVAVVRVGVTVVVVNASGWEGNSARRLYVDLLVRAAVDRAIMYP